MATIQPRGETLWIFYSVDGKMQRKSLKLKNTKQNYRLALSKASEISEMIENHIIPQESDLLIERVSKSKKIESFQTLEFYMQMFLSNDEIKPKNKMMFFCAFKKFKEVIDTNIPINEVTELHYHTYNQHLKESKLSYDTRRTYINYLNIVFNKLIKQKLYHDENPFLRLKAKSKPFIRTIPEQEFEIIINYIKSKNLELYRYIYFLWLTAFRMTEALLLTWEDVKFTDGVIDVTRFKDGNRKDLFPLSISNGNLLNLLLSFKQEKGRIFNLNDSYVREHFQNYIQKINKEQKKLNENWKEIPKYTLHDLRRTAISRWAKKLSPSDLKVIAGHRNIETTLKFYISSNVLEISNKLNKE